MLGRNFTVILYKMSESLKLSLCYVTVPLLSGAVCSSCIGWEAVSKPVLLHWQRARWALRGACGRCRHREGRVASGHCLSSWWYSPSSCTRMIVLVQTIVQTCFSPSPKPEEVLILPIRAVFHKTTEWLTGKCFFPLLNVRVSLLGFFLFQKKEKTKTLQCVAAYWKNCWTSLKFVYGWGFWTCLLLLFEISTWVFTTLFEVSQRFIPTHRHNFRTSQCQLLLNQSPYMRQAEFQEIILKTTGKCWVNSSLTVSWHREVSEYIKFWILGTCDGGGNGKCVVARLSEERVVWLQSRVREATVHKIVHVMRTVIFIFPHGESIALNVKLL